MAKNIVILLDGTSNQISGDRTNVLRLYGSLKRSRSQLVFYQPGVGTFVLSGWWQQLKSKTRIVLGLATGAGISCNVMQAYEFLVRHHEYGDRIYIFGFSRGSYTARLLDGFIRIFGWSRKSSCSWCTMLDAPDPLADIKNSMNFAWDFVEFLPRKLPKTSFYRQLQIGRVY